MAHPLPSALLPVIVNDTYLQEHPIYHTLLYNKDYRKTSGGFPIDYCLRELSHMIASNFYPTSSGCNSQIRGIYGWLSRETVQFLPDCLLFLNDFCKESTASVYKKKNCPVKSGKVNIYLGVKEYILKGQSSTLTLEKISLHCLRAYNIPSCDHPHF